jgi:hypothetical protein
MSLLEEDLYLWTKHVAKAIRDGTLDPAEWENVADEIEGIGVRDALAISDLLGRILSTMLRLKHEAGQPMGDLLKALLLNDRIALKVILECSPSLYDEAKDEVQGAYEMALAWYELENDLPKSKPPPSCPFAFEEIVG